MMRRRSHSRFGRVKSGSFDDFFSFHSRFRRASLVSSRHLESPREYHSRLCIIGVSKHIVDLVFVCEVIHRIFRLRLLLRWVRTVCLSLLSSGDGSSEGRRRHICQVNFLIEK